MPLITCAHIHVQIRTVCTFIHLHGVNAKANVILHPCICYTAGVLCIIKLFTHVCAKQGIVIGLVSVCDSNKATRWSNTTYIIVLPTGYFVACAWFN